jgi:hypothetical protein
MVIVVMVRFFAVVPIEHFTREAFPSPPLRRSKELRLEEQVGQSDFLGGEITCGKPVPAM